MDQKVKIVWSVLILVMLLSSGILTASENAAGFDLLTRLRNTQSLFALIMVNDNHVISIVTDEDDLGVWADLDLKHIAATTASSWNAYRY